MKPVFNPFQIQLYTFQVDVFASAKVNNEKPNLSDVGLYLYNS